MAGAEFGVEPDSFSNQSPGAEGTDYVFPNASSVEYFGRKGVWLLRLPFRWERMQPSLDGDLDTAHVNAIRRITRSAKKHGSLVILDVHNYGRYRTVINGTPRTCIIDELVDGTVPVTRQHFANLWRRLAIEFRNEPGVTAYGLMNEPHDMEQSSWKLISQHAVDAIRKVDTKTTLLVAGDHWSNADRFAEINGAEPWIRDPSQRVVYEAHCYFDQDGSGKYVLPFEAELRRDPDLHNRGVERVEPFLEWCRKNKVKGFVGEYGTPPDAGWKAVTIPFLKACTKNRTPVCYWAAGEWWGDYPLSIHPQTDSPAPQLLWLLHKDQ